MFTILPMRQKYQPKIVIQDLKKPENRYLLLILYWPVYLAVFLILERVLHVEYHEIHSALDDMIPFCEYFIAPYLYWFAFWIGMLIYLLFTDTPAFKKMMVYMIITYTISLICYFIYPSCQHLRPESFPRQNLFSTVIDLIYKIDTSTNICPSEHVLAAFGTVFASFHSKHFRTMGWHIYFVSQGILISLSTLFVKQHSVIDILTALPVCALGYLLAFSKYSPFKNL